MNSFLPIKLTIQDFSLNTEMIPIENITLSITFNRISSLFKAPFASLPLQLVNFPIASLMHIQFYLKQACIAESQFSIESIQHKKVFEFTTEIKTSEELGAPEQFIPAEVPEKSDIFKGNLKILIEKEDLDSRECQLCPFIEDFSTVSERTLEIIMEMNNNTEIIYDHNINNI